MKRFAKIKGTGGYLPANIFTNKDWEQRVNTSHDWIVERTGIESRHFASPDETCASMGAVAGQRALEMSGLEAKDIGMVIVATGLPDKVFPSTACLIQKQLQIPTCVAFDVQAACTGFIYALSIADQFIKNGVIENALIVGTETMSRLIDWQDRNTCVLFGDGAGAVVLSASDESGIIATDLFASGKYDSILKLDNYQLAASKDAKAKLGAELNPFIYMEGKKVFKIAVTMLGKMIEDVQHKHNLKDGDIDWLVPHQANIRIIKATADKLGISMDKVISTNAHHGNTSSASIPLALDVAVRDKRIVPGQLLFFEAFGAGLTWGSALVRF